MLVLWYGAQWLGGRELSHVPPVRAEGRLRCFSGGPIPQLPAREEAKLPPGNSGVASASWNAPDLGVRAATSLSLF